MKTKMNACRGAMSALAVLVFTGVAGAANTIYNWTGPTAANAPTNAYVWAVDGNWDQPTYPQGANAEAKFANSANIYVRLPDNLTVNMIRANSTGYMLAENVTARESTGRVDPVTAPLCTPIW